MGVDAAIDITTEERQTVLALLQRHLPGTAAWVYGSRVKWTSRPQSDLDLVVFATPEQRPQVGDLREAFEESNLPFRVDLFVWDGVPDPFRERIETEHVVIESSAIDGNALRGAQPSHLVALLDDLCDAIIDCPHSTPVWMPDGVIVLRSKNIRNGRLNLSEPSYTSERDYAQRIKRAAPRPGDLVITREAPMGEVCMIPAGLRCCLDQRMVLLRPHSATADPRYLLYALQSERVQQEIRQHDGTGSTVSNLRISLLKALRIPSHRVSDQRAIAHILGTLDDKIELNRRMNATLDAMARALFRSWFVDFDPVRAKMEGRDTGLPKDIADLFPDRLVDSELGEIPEGWRISEIGLEVDAVGGTTPSTKEPAYWNEGQHLWATPRDLSKLLSPVLLDTDRKITDAGARKISSGVLPAGTVLLSSRAPIGYLAIAEVPTAINQGFIAMICRKQLPNLYVLFWCYENLEHIKNIAGGSTFAEINKKAFRPLPVVVPSERVLDVYADAGRSLYDRVASNTRESGLLVSSRDALLPRLVAGELRVTSREPACRLDDRPASVGAHGA